MAKIGRLLHGLSDATGRVVAWLLLPMVAGTFVIVVLRYAFDSGWIWMQELVVWMHAALFMLASAYTLKHDAHVRVDIFYREFSPARKAWVNLIGSLVLLFPMALFLTWSSLDYVITSWSIGEGSREAGGLPFPFVPMLKSVIPLSFLLVAAEGAAIMLDSVRQLRLSREAT